MFLARSLDRGGAERQLISLLLGLRDLGWKVSIACFYGGAAFQEEIQSEGVSFHDLGKRGRWDMAHFLLRLRHVVRSVRPDIIHGYMPVPNMLALGVSLAAARPAVVWGIRASNMQFESYDWLSAWSFRAECVLARYADLIISNSQAGARHRIAHGFPESRVITIPNGIDTERFRYDAEGRTRLRREWSLGEDEVVVGVVARLDPMKDHVTFLDAVRQLCDSEQGAGLRFVCVGDGADHWTRHLEEYACSLGLEGRVLWAGARNNMAAVYSALDIVVLPSAFGEGFSNAIGEAMACGRTCVVTDVGDMASVVGDHGIVTPPRDAAALARAIGLAGEYVRQHGCGPRSEVRERVVRDYSVSALVQRSCDALARLNSSRLNSSQTS
ncbi:glycosyltransferase [Salinisphaera orenii]|uniref:Glycosyltransferase subfamily 4-like N-terminal domain-containing protein n=1 Tax=Salinisphaera orenii YIM 95161 TaxID=1051139 RepID=A0A423Q1W7_9GAMM|nr:glycosyltransferase [Salinisphaera halophila]ROO32503.1 hypothetical protein SAHL_04900 [Salinisphaera halophila YIM 95161]